MFSSSFSCFDCHYPVNMARVKFDTPATQCVNFYIQCSDQWRQVCHMSIVPPYLLHHHFLRAMDLHPKIPVCSNAHYHILSSYFWLLKMQHLSGLNFICYFSTYISNWSISCYTPWQPFSYSLQLLLSPFVSANFLTNLHFWSTHLYVSFKEVPELFLGVYHW